MEDQLEEQPSTPTADDLPLHVEDQLEEQPSKPTADDLPLHVEHQLEERPSTPTADDLPLHVEDQLKEQPSKPTADDFNPPLRSPTKLPPPIDDTEEEHPLPLTADTLLLQGEHLLEQQSLPPMDEKLPLVTVDELPAQKEDAQNESSDLSSPQTVDEVEINYYSLQEIVSFSSCNKILLGSIQLHKDIVHSEPKDEQYLKTSQIKSRPLEEQQAAAVLLKVVQTLSVLHSQGKVNNNVTIANITLSDSGDIKLTDSNSNESILTIVPEASQLTDDDKV